MGLGKATIILKSTQQRIYRRDFTTNKVVISPVCKTTDTATITNDVVTFAEAVAHKVVSDIVIIVIASNNAIFRRQATKISNPSTIKILARRILVFVISDRAVD